MLASTQVADRLAERAWGLVGRTECNGAVLLRGGRCLHTAGTRLTVDAAFLDRDMVVRATVRLGPWRMAMPRPGTRNVLVSAAGNFERWGLCLGDRLELREVG